jgi:hypothetical protein
MVVNFRAHKINRGTNKLVRITMLIKKNHSKQFFLIVFVVVWDKKKWNNMKKKTYSLDKNST